MKKTRNREGKERDGEQRQKRRVNVMGSFVNRTKKSRKKRKWLFLKPAVCGLGSSPFSVPVRRYVSPEASWGVESTAAAASVEGLFPSDRTITPRWSTVTVE